MAVFRAPNDLTVGPTEVLPLLARAGWRVAIDPLAAEVDEWRPFRVVAAQCAVPCLGWTRVYGIDVWQMYRARAAQLELAGDLPNIEDPDLERWHDAGILDVTLAAILGPRTTKGVLTNYRAHDLWARMDFGKPCAFEWFPREQPADATLAGAQEIAERHFNAALPLLDGRDAPWRGLEVGPIAGVFPADSVFVPDWESWLWRRGS